MFTDAEHHAFLTGLRLFNAGQFFDAHEAWEDAWRPMATGTTRECLQGLIQCAVALEHHRRGNDVGAARVLERATRRLATVPSVYAGIDIARLLRETTATIEHGGAAPAIARLPQPGEPGAVSEG